MFLNIVCKPESTAESIESAVAVVFGVALLSQLVDCKTKYLIQNNIVLFIHYYILLPDFFILLKNVISCCSIKIKVNIFLDGYSKCIRST